MLTRSKAKKQCSDKSGKSESVSTKSSSSTIQARILAAEAEHLRRITDLESAERERALAAERTVAEAEHRARIAALEAEAGGSRRSSFRSVVGEWLDRNDAVNSNPITLHATTPQVQTTLHASVTMPAPSEPLSGVMVAAPSDVALPDDVRQTPNPCDSSSLPYVSAALPNSLPAATNCLSYVYSAPIITTAPQGGTLTVTAPGSTAEGARVHSHANSAGTYLAAVPHPTPGGLRMEVQDRERMPVNPAAQDHTLNNSHKLGTQPHMFNCCNINKNSSKSDTLRLAEAIAEVAVSGASRAPRKLPIAVSRWAQLALLCGAALLVNAVAAPWTLLALLPACLFYLGLQSVYLHNARELQGSEARSAAGVVSLAAQAAAGGGTLRAGRLQPRMRAAFLARLDHNHAALLLLNAANRWLGLTLDLVGAASVCASLGVSLCGGSAAAAALAGSYALLLPAFLAHLAKCRADLDLQLAAVARVRAHSALPQEDYREDCPIPTGWERNGKIEMENLVVQQEPGTLPILNNINLAINPGEKVAICGRSGSGKSTLLLSCVGGTTITNGRILVDGVDARRVPLRALRHRIVVLPQEATMFSGTLRENLDPLAVHTDEEIWHSIRAVGLYDFVTSQPAGLECSVGKARCGWSGGRAARASAARALLHARLASALLLDEPGAALDAPGERALLAGMAAAAPDTTIITVAHRVSSVRGYDRGVVLEAGRAVEQGPVPALLATPGSRLAAMLATPHNT